MTSPEKVNSKTTNIGHDDLSSDDWEAVFESVDNEETKRQTDRIVAETNSLIFIPHLDESCTHSQNNTTRTTGHKEALIPPRPMKQQKTKPTLINQPNSVIAMVEVTRVISQGKGLTGSKSLPTTWKKSESTKRLERLEGEGCSLTTQDESRKDIMSILEKFTYQSNRPVVVEKETRKDKKKGVIKHTFLFTQLLYPSLPLGGTKQSAEVIYPTTSLSRPGDSIQQSKEENNDITENTPTKVSTTEHASRQTTQVNIGTGNLISPQGNPHDDTKRHVSIQVNPAQGILSHAKLKEDSEYVKRNVHAPSESGHLGAHDASITTAFTGDKKSIITVVPSKVHTSATSAPRKPARNETGEPMLFSSQANATNSPNDSNNNNKKPAERTIESLHPAFPKLPEGTKTLFKNTSDKPQTDVREFFTEPVCKQKDNVI
jgi:hypothetical protein